MEEVELRLSSLLQQENSGNAIQVDLCKADGHWGGGCIVVDGIRFLYDDALFQAMECLSPQTFERMFILTAEICGMEFDLSEEGSTWEGNGLLSDIAALADGVNFPAHNDFTWCEDRNNGDHFALQDNPEECYAMWEQGQVDKCIESLVPYTPQLESCIEAKLSEDRSQAQKQPDRHSESSIS